MTRVIPLAALLALAAPLHADDKPKPGDKAEPTALRTQYDEIQKEFGKLMQAKMKAAKDDAEREAIFAKLPEFGGPFADRALKLARENLKDPAALEVLSFALIVGQSSAAADVIVTSFQDHKDLAGVCMELAGNAPDNPAVVGLLTTLSQKAADKTVKGTATFALATALLTQADKGGDSKKAEALLAGAEANATTVTKEFADIPGQGEKLGEAAKKLLFQIRHLAVGRPAPEVTSHDLADKETKLSAYKGKVVVLDIWATWCGPCKAMIPHEREMVEKLKGKPFALISVSADEEKEALTKFLEKEKMPWTHWWEGSKKGTMLKDWNVTFFPTIYVLDAKGVIRYKHVRGKKLEEAVEKLVKEAETK